jgi:hypothetical protein
MCFSACRTDPERLYSYTQVSGSPKPYISGVYNTPFLAGSLPNIRSYTMCINGSGQPYIIYTVYVWHSWQGDYQIYDHIRCIYMLMANNAYMHASGQRCIYTRFWPTMHIHTLMANGAYIHASGQP